MIRVLFFASLREQLECDQLALDAAVENLTVDSLISQLVIERGDLWAQALSQENLIAAVNQEVVSGETPVKDGDEVAFFPPVTGG